MFSVARIIGITISMLVYGDKWYLVSPFVVVPFRFREIQMILV